MLSSYCYPVHDFCHGLKTDYDFNRDLFDFTTQLNDGHTRMLII
jgi:hypothetical protein